MPARRARRRDGAEQSGLAGSRPLACPWRLCSAILGSTSPGKGPLQPRRRSFVYIAGLSEPHSGVRLDGRALRSGGCREGGARLLAGEPHLRGQGGWGAGEILLFVDAALSVGAV